MLLSPSQRSELEQDKDEVDNAIDQLQLQAVRQLEAEPDTETIVFSKPASKNAAAAQNNVEADPTTKTTKPAKKDEAAAQKKVDYYLMTYKKVPAQAVCDKVSGRRHIAYVLTLVILVFCDFCASFYYLS